MSREGALIEALRAVATTGAARELRDDAAVLAVDAGTLVLTHDMLVEGVHYLPADPPEDVAWKLVAVNLSDLAAKGAVPVGLLLGYTLGRDQEWDAAFVRGLASACATFDAPLLGGDTVGATTGGAQTLGLTAIGRASGAVPDRRHARAGEALFVTGTIGDAGLGLRAARGEIDDPALLAAYRRPRPQLAAGLVLARHVAAMADVSDGLLIDAARIAEASGLGVTVDLARVPLSSSAARWGSDRAARLAAATAGDDYQLLFAAPADVMRSLAAAIAPLPLTVVGGFSGEAGVRVTDGGYAIALPHHLGWEHG